MRDDIHLIPYDGQEDIVLSLIAGFWKDHNNVEMTDEELRQDLDAWTAPGHLLYLIMKDDAWIGFVHLGSRGGAIDWMEDLYITKEYRGRGIGSYVIARVEEFIQTWSDSMYIEVASRNLDAMRLYHRLGYDVLNTVTIRKDFHPEDFTTASEETISHMNFHIKKRKQ
ncbi:MAG: GNAT family N-acetyltransferase [Bulleidia sp.]